jgi:BlaI family transcriptional regulator, penicillinase repressor
MKKTETPRLLASELEILEMLWRTGPVTIVEAQRAMPGEIGYTTVQTRLNRLCKKNAVKRSKESPARYSAAIKPEAVANGDLNILLDKVSGGQVVPLVAYLVKDRTLTSAEIDELKQMIAEAESKTHRDIGKKPCTQ